MIKAYLTWISTQYEGEDVEIRYRIFEDEELITKESVYIDYQKPALLGQYAIKTLLKEFQKHKDKEIVIVINDGFLYEILRGTTWTKNYEVRHMATKTIKSLEKFENLTIENISGNHIEIEKWNKILKP